MSRVPRASGQDRWLKIHASQIAPGKLGKTGSAECRNAEQKTKNQDRSEQRCQPQSDADAIRWTISIMMPPDSSLSLFRLVDR